MILNNNMELYHGSYMIVDKPDLAKCNKGKDFGQGFYITTDYNQAKKFVSSSIRKAMKNGATVDGKKGYVSVYKMDIDLDYKIYEFKSADSEWLHCVAAHRRSSLFKNGVLDEWKKYDVIIGKIADDTTNQVITAYIEGLYGEPGTETADNIAISLLMPERLNNQICIRTDKALDALKFIRYDSIEVIKK